jgi:hypothetical protein
LPPISVVVTRVVTRVVTPRRFADSSTRTQGTAPAPKERRTIVNFCDDGRGSAAASLGFYREHAHRLGDVVEAIVRFPGWDEDGPPAHHLMLRSAAGDQLYLSGAAAGYPGEGPRIAMQVLVESGFPAEQARLGFTEPQLRLTRRPSTPARPEAVADAAGQAGTPAPVEGARR